MRILERVLAGEHLTEEEAEEAIAELFESATDTQIAGLLVGLRQKGETPEEIAGFASGMKRAARTISPEVEGRLIDTCGTGGDGADTFNISTAAAIVASAETPVAKHGNYSVSSRSGSADVLKALGVDIEAEPEEVERSIEENDIGFMLAPVFHPSMKAVIGPRRELGVRTVFNVLGPLTNPAGAEAQVVGVFDPGLTEILAETLGRLGSKHSLVVHGSGTDELALHGPTEVSEQNGSEVETYEVGPGDFGLDGCGLEELAGGSPEENAETLLGILRGDVEGPRRDVVLLNAGAALYVAGRSSIEAGIRAAERAIGSGDALEQLEKLSGEQF
ncbi:MAG: Anthranilate phosphoribosyltransferase [Methanonatronarchaeales archaeon]|nr:Anthranilate phosphoribosyltransferase [Methanonatronarchaeales archaeon]